MTEKRFQVTQTTFGSGIYDFQAEDTLCESYDEDAYSQVVKKLNELYEENKNLKHEVEYLENKDRDNRLERIRMINQMRYR